MHRKISNRILLKSYLTEINPVDYKNDPDKLDFLGTYADPNSPIKLLKSVDKMKVDELLRSLNNPLCWEKPIFNDRYLPYFAMTAYLQDKISRQKASHILEFYELKLTYPDVISIPILTKKGNFTYASKEYFDSVIKFSRSNIPNITIEHLEKFRLSLLENKDIGTAFFVLYFRPSNNLDARNHIGFSNLLGSIDYSPMGTVFIPSTVRNYFYPAITPKNSTKILSIGKLGKFSIDVMEENHRKNIRIHALGFPGTYRTLQTHGYNTTLSDSTAHDAQHQGAISYFPLPLYQMSLHCLDILRKITEIKWSAELWPLIDMYVIDSKINVLNHKADLNNRSMAITYSTNEGLSQFQCQLWISNLLKAISEDLLFKILLHDMVINKSTWENWINIEDFISENLSIEFKQAIEKPLSLSEIMSEDYIQSQLINGFITNWPSITQTTLGKLINFEKTSSNRIYFSLLNEPIYHYSNDELKALLMDIDQNYLSGIELIYSASSGNLESVKNLQNVAQSFNYSLIALRFAAKNGHADCVNYILNNSSINPSSTHYFHGLEEAAKHGHKECVNLLLGKMDALKIKPDNVFLTAVKNKRAEIVDLFLCQNKFKLSIYTLNNAILHALDHHDSLMTKQLLSYITKKNKVHELLNQHTQINIYKMIRTSPDNCLSIIMDTFIDHSTLTYQKIFTAIAKNGSIACAKEFISYLNNRFAYNEIERNKILMNCMIEGFSSDIASDYFTQPFNLHHDMVRLQIDQYLQSSVANNFWINQISSPKKYDIKNLLEKIFLTYSEGIENKIYTLCEIPLLYLIHHEMLKADHKLHKYCLSLAIDMAVNHPEPYYLRLLFRSDAKVDFNKLNDEMSVNGIIINKLSSPEVKCLLWIAYAINEIQTFYPNSGVVKESLLLARQFDSFEKEMFNLIHGGSIKLNAHILNLLKYYFCNDEKHFKIKNFIEERIAFLKEPELHFIDRYDLTIFNYPLLSYQTNYTQNEKPHESLKLLNKNTP